MKKDSGFGFRVSGLLFRGALIAGLLIYSLVLSGLSGQELRYSFKKGEIMDYELINNNKDAVQFSMVSKYRFTVVSAEKDRFRLTMKLTSIYIPRVITFSEQTIGIDLKLLSGRWFSNKMNYETNAEMNHPVTFTLDSNGNILDIRGNDKIWDEILQAVEQSPGKKAIGSYTITEARYGKQKYAYLIHEFFPAIPHCKKDTVSIFVGTNHASRINVWPAGPNLRDSSGTIRLKRIFVSRNGNRAFDSSSFKDTVNDMTLKWPISSGFPIQISHQGYDPDFLFWDIYEGGIGLKDLFERVQINNTNHSDNGSSKVFISGSISNLAGKQLLAVLPGTGISRAEVPIIPDESGKFSIEFDLVNSEGLMEITSLSGKPGLIRLYVKPGDTVNLSVDLNNLKTLFFTGSTAKEQNALNQLSRVSSPANPDSISQVFRNNVDLLARQKGTLDPGFVKYMDLENRYAFYGFQIWNLRSRSFKVELDSLQKYRNYLGNPDGFKSPAYQSFIRTLVWDFSFAIHPEQDKFFDSATIILSGWDLYWYRALQVEEEFSNNRQYFYELYQRFSELYPGTEFKRILSEKYKLTDKGRIGTTVPKFNLTDITGKSHSFREFKGQYWCIIATGSDNPETNKNLARAESFNKDRDKPVTFLVWVPDDSTRELMRTSISSKNLILLAGSNKNPEFSEFVKNFPEDIIVIDPSNRIATYGIGDLANILTWPVSKTTKEKTVNLSVLWYSLAGAFTLSILIILIIRLRAKRREARMNLNRRITQLEVDAVRSRMNPHFLFNALGSIQNLVNRGKNQEASLYLARFGDLVRTILTQSSKTVIGLNEEIDLIRNYLMLEQLGFNFSFDISVGEDLDPATIEVPPLLIQPHVENAVIHGVSSLGEQGSIWVRFRLENEILICEVSDNGPGYQPRTQTEKEGFGEGWKLTDQRIRLMKEQYDQVVTAEISSLKQPWQELSGLSGTTVTFRLPVLNQIR